MPRAAESHGWGIVPGLIGVSLLNFSWSDGQISYAYVAIITWWLAEARHLDRVYDLRRYFHELSYLLVPRPPFYASIPYTAQVKSQAVT